MQCHLETDELNLVADLLLEQISAISARASADLRVYNALLDKVIARDLRFDSDEFDQVAQLLTGKRALLKDQIASETNPTLKTELQRMLTVTEQALEKVEEACAMF